VGQNSVGVFANEIVDRMRSEVEGGDDGEDGGSGVGGQAHVANVDLVQRSLAHAEHQRTLLFQANVGGSLDELSREAVGNLGQCAHAAWDHDHRVGGIGAAGNVGADVVVALRMNFLWIRAEYLLDQIAAAGYTELFGNDAQCAIAGDEVDSLDSLVVLQCE